MKTHIFRLRPEEDLKKSIDEYVIKHQIEVAVVLSVVGSVVQYEIRVSDGKTVISKKEPREIITVSGLCSQDGSHLHISLSDVHGSIIAGHLMDGCLINTTAEIVLLEIDNIKLTREFDVATGYKELVARPISD